MRRIEKGPPPKELEDWTEAQQAIGVNFDYGSLSKEAKEAVRDQLCREQRGLCAYTGHAIVDGDFHIEHLKPQRLCAPGEDVDHDNLVAAFNRRADLPYGATAKGHWYDPDLFVSPTDPGCETRFTFDQFGRILPSSGDDEAAVTTIRVLCLDHPRLTELREAQIEEWLFGEDDGLSGADPEQVSAALDRMADEVDRPLTEFEFAVRAVARQLGRAGA